jgi:hypothetical protein
MSKPHKPQFIGDINPDIDDYDAEYIRLAQWLDKFLPKEPLKTYDVKLSNSNKATYESVEVIKKLIEEGKKDMVIRTLRLRYTKDIHRVETVHRARDLLRRHKKAADCDDFVILTGALLQSIGHPVRIVIIGNNYKDKEDYSHIYLHTLINKKWISLDGSVPGAKAGWEAPKYATKKLINLDGFSAPEEVAPSKSKILLWLLMAYVIYLLVN